MFPAKLRIQKKQYGIKRGVVQNKKSDPRGIRSCRLSAVLIDICTCRRQFSLPRNASSQAVCAKRTRVGLCPRRTHRISITIKSEPHRGHLRDDLHIFLLFYYLKLKYYYYSINTLRNIVGLVPVALVSAFCRPVKNRRYSHVVCDGPAEFRHAVYLSI